MTGVDPKAVLAGRIPGRPSVGLIIGLVISSVCALVALGIDAISGGGAGFAVGLIMAVLPMPLLIALVLTLDRMEPEPWRDLSFAFMWGAGVAVLGALLLNTAGLHFITGPLFGAERGNFISAAVGAPLIEESLKGAVLFGFLWFRRHEIDGLTDGIIYAAMVALGFAMLENVTYYMRAFDIGGAHQLTTVFIIRGVISPLGHPLFTSMTGLGVAYAALRGGAARVVAPSAGLLGAMLLHGMWNGSTKFGLGGLATAYLVDFCVLLAIVVIVVRERRRTVDLIGCYLPMYGGTGLVTPRDVAMLTRLSTRRQARQWARLRGGNGAARAMGDYQHAATELALLHQRAERGTADPGWFAHRRDALLGLMQIARQAFLRNQPEPGTPPWAGHGPSGFGPVPPPSAGGFPAARPAHPGPYVGPAGPAGPAPGWAAWGGQVPPPAPEPPGVRRPPQQPGQQPGPPHTPPTYPPN